MRAPFILSLALLAAAASAQTLPANPPTTSPFEGDARLNKVVTVRWKKASLVDALQEISTATGVRLAPDRAVVDEPVMAAAKEMPARKLLEQLALLEHFTWVRSGGTAAAPGYLLYQSRAAKTEEENEINASRRAVTEELQRQLARYRQLGKLPPDQLQKEAAKAEDLLETTFSGGFAGLLNNGAGMRNLQDAMMVNTISTPSGRAMLNVIDGLTPQQWALLGDEEPVVLSSKPQEGEFALSSSVQDQLRESSPGINLPKAIFRVVGGEQVQNALHELDVKMKDAWGKADGFKVTLQLNLALGAQPVGMFRVSPEPMGQSDIAQMFALSGLMLTAQPALTTAPVEDPMAREARLGADPVLGKKAVLKLPPPPAQPAGGQTGLLGSLQRMGDLLPAVEEAYGLHLVSDAYTRQFISVGTTLTSGELPLYQVLDRLAGMARRWELDGDTVRFRSKTWAHDRRAEIPVRYMRRWIDQRTRNGSFTLDDVAEMATLLRDEQVESLMNSALEQGSNDIGDFIMVTSNREILRVWGKLLPLQKRNLLAGGAIPVANLYPPQQQLLIALSRRKNQSMFAMFQSKPQRSAQRLATGVLSVVSPLKAGATAVEDAPAGAAPPVPPGGGAARAGAAAGPFGGLANAYIIRLVFPDGQKDEYSIALTRTTQAASPAAPVAPMK